MIWRKILEIVVAPNQIAMISIIQSIEQNFYMFFCSLHCKDNMRIGQLYGTADVKNTNDKPY
jgi:hypothetical protein